MTDLLVEADRQLDMGWGRPAVAATPMNGSGDRKVTQPELANYYRVACNAGAFLVKASDPFWIGYNLEDGIKMPMPHVKHDAESGNIPTLQSLLGLEEIDHLTIETEQIMGSLAIHYGALDMNLVTYLGTSASPTSE